MFQFAGLGFSLQGSLAFLLDGFPVDPVLHRVVCAGSSFDSAKRTDWRFLHSLSCFLQASSSNSFKASFCCIVAVAWASGSIFTVGRAIASFLTSVFNCSS